MSLVLESEAEARFPSWRNGERDFKAWAKRILYRFDHNDKDLTRVQIDCAQRAMHIAEGDKNGSE